MRIQIIISGVFLFGLLFFISLVGVNAQETVTAYDMNHESHVIIRDSTQTDEDVLSQLNLDDYEVGEEVRITDEMWEQMQQKKKPTPQTTVQSKKRTPIAKVTKKRASKKKRKARKKRKRRW